VKLHAIAAAALFAAAGTASAQSVTVYGLLDLGVQKSNAGTATWRDGPTTKAWELRESKGSRLGFRGNEDLGGGLSAQFLIEHRFTPDTGAANATFWNGASYVQLTSKDLGAVYLGRDYTPYRNLAVRLDPFGQDGVGKFDARSYAYYGGGRTANTLGYRSPRFGGLTAQLALSLNEGSTTPRETGFNLVYAAGPIYAGLAYSQQDDGRVATPTASGNGSNLLMVGASYNLGFITPMFTYTRTETGANSNLKNDFLLVGATATLGTGTAKIGYGRFDPSGGNNLQQKFAVGYDYPLSKRTRLYADYATSRQKGNFSTYNAYALGLQHNF
jgi:predicted porin